MVILWFLKIAALTIAINGETTGLDKVLSGVNKKSRDLQSELREVERLLKLESPAIPSCWLKNRNFSDT